MEEVGEADGADSRREVAGDVGGGGPRLLFRPT